MMKTLDIAHATDSLARYTKSLHHEAVVVTDRGKPVAALMPIENADAETVTLSTHPQFLALIERARIRHQQEGGMTSHGVRRQLSIKPNSAKKRHRIR